MTRLHRGRNLAAFFMILAAAGAVPAAGADWKEHRDAGQEALQAGALDEAEEQMKQAVVAAKKLGPDHPAEQAEAYLGLSDVYLKQERMTEANIVLEQSLLLLAQVPAAESRVLEPIYGNLATVRTFQNNLGEAESLLKRALVLREKRLGTEHIDLAELLDPLVVLATMQRDHAHAQSLEQRALAIREKASQSKPLEQIAVLKDGADWYRMRDDEASEALWRRVLPLQEKALGAEHRDVADTLMKIVGFHLGLGESGGLTITLDLKSVNLFPDDAATQRLRQDILNRFREYEPMLVRALAIREKALGPDDPGTIEVVQYLASGYVMRVDPARARPLYERILAAREKTLGPAHPDLKTALHFLGGIAYGERRYRDAIPFLERLVALQAAERAKAPPDDSPLKPLLLVSERPDGEVEKDDPNDYAAMLRRAIRLADVFDTPGAFPTEQDLAFLKAEGWCPTVSDLSDLLEVAQIEVQNKRVDNAALAHIRGLVNLKSLTVNPGNRIVKPNIDDDGLAQLRHLTALQTLDLSGTAISGSGLAALQGMSELRHLSLNFTYLNDTGLKALPMLPKLEILQISGTGVTDASVPLLKRLPGLKSVWILHSRISERGAEELHQTIPGVNMFVLPGPTP